MAQSIPRVPIPPPLHWGGGGFVILFWKSCKCPMVGPGGSNKDSMVGLNISVQMPHPTTTPQLHFPVNKLQLPYSRTSLFRTRLIRSPRYFEGRSNALGFTLPLYASPVISKPRYFELFFISLGTSK